VVPYSPWLLSKYRAHINLEALMSVKGVKYVFKYIYKGYDSANVEAQVDVLNHDEVKHFIDSRYFTISNITYALHFSYKFIVINLFDV
jgi:hypothetical protein